MGNTVVECSGCSNIPPTEDQLFDTKTEMEIDGVKFVYVIAIKF